MANQFDVYANAGEPLAVIIQSDLLSDLATRVIIPLFEPISDKEVMRALNPQVTFQSRTLILSPQLMATVFVSDLGEHLGTLDKDRDVIIRAVDALLSGI